MAYVVEIPLIEPHSQIGDFPGWEERISDLDYLAEIAGVFKDGNRQLRQDEIAEILLLEGEARPLPCAFTSSDGVIIIQQPIRDVLEALDPGVHQIVPIDVWFEDGTKAKHPCFVLNIHVHQSSIIDEKSDVRPHVGYKETRDIMFISHARKNITLDRAKLSSINLWRERRYPESILMSDTLNAELASKKLDFFEMWKAKEE